LSAFCFPWESKYSGVIGRDRDAVAPKITQSEFVDFLSILAGASARDPVLGCNQDG
jgi:hypothetical protein